MNVTNRRVWRRGIDVGDWGKGHDRAAVGAEIDVRVVVDIAVTAVLVLVRIAVDSGSGWPQELIDIAFHYLEWLFHVHLCTY